MTNEKCSRRSEGYMFFSIVIITVTAAIAGAGWLALRMGMRPGRLLIIAVAFALVAAAAGIAWGTIYLGQAGAVGWILGLLVAMVIVLTTAALISFYQYMQRIQVIRRVEEEGRQT